MIGFILYEVVDVVYHIGKLGFNGIYYGYKYYKGENNNENTNNENTNNEQNEFYLDRIKKLEDKINQLESKID
jgi:hypothetical protein